MQLPNKFVKAHFYAEKIDSFKQNYQLFAPIGTADTYFLRNLPFFR